MLRRAAAVLADESDRVRIINHHHCVVFVSHFIGLVHYYITYSYQLTYFTYVFCI